MTNGAPPRVFISYSHDDPAHEERVLKLADRLCADGIDRASTNTSSRFRRRGGRSGPRRRSAPPILS